MTYKFAALVFASFLQIGILEESQIIRQPLDPYSLDTITQDIAELKQQIAEIRDAILGENLQNKAIINEIKELTAAVDDAIADIHIRNPLPADCKDVQARGATSSGLYRIKPRAAPSDFMVFCDLTLQGGGWTYVVNRRDGLEDFQLPWAAYKMGFGDVQGSTLVRSGASMRTDHAPNELLFELILQDSTVYHVRYDHFRIGTEFHGYVLLELGAYSGNATDQFRNHRFMRFSTKDSDNDEYVANCAEDFKGAWWYKTCYTCQLTGTYGDTLRWNDLGTIREARMMIRPRSGKDA